MRIEQVLDHLAHRLPGFEPEGGPVALEGGLLNHTWRVDGRPHSVIVKHAPGHIATAPDMALDPSRLVFEARALSALAPGGLLESVADERARPPRPLDFDAEASVLIMEDLGDWPDLGEAIARDADAAAIGRALGRFIGKLHGASFERDDLRRSFSNLPIQQTRLDVQYAPVSEWLLVERLEPARAERLGARTRELGERLLEPGVCLLMGDLWPPSILLPDSGLRLIDWEFTHFGHPAQDLAHLAAHLYMASLVSPGGAFRETWCSFCAAYAEAAGPLRGWLLTEWARLDLATHCAAEIFARTLGPFAASYLFAGRDTDHPARRHAVDRAIALLESDEPVAELQALI